MMLAIRHRCVIARAARANAGNNLPAKMYSYLLLRPVAMSAFGAPGVPKPERPTPATIKNMTAPTRSAIVAAVWRRPKK